MKLSEMTQGFTVGGYRVTWADNMATFHEFKVSIPVYHKDFTMGWVQIMTEKLRKLKVRGH